MPVYDTRVLRVANKEESVQCIQRRSPTRPARRATSWC